MSDSPGSDARLLPNSISKSANLTVPFELRDGAIPWSHIGITGDYLWNEIDRPLERFRPLRATTSIQKVSSFLSGYYGTKDLGALSRSAGHGLCANRQNAWQRGSEEGRAWLWRRVLSNVIAARATRIAVTRPTQCSGPSLCRGHRAGFTSTDTGEASAPPRRGPRGNRRCSRPRRGSCGSPRCCQARTALQLCRADDAIDHAGERLDEFHPGHLEGIHGRRIRVQRGSSAPPPCPPSPGRGRWRCRPIGQARG